MQLQPRYAQATAPLYHIQEDLEQLSTGTQDRAEALLWDQVTISVSLLHLQQHITVHGPTVAEHQHVKL